MAGETVQIEGLAELMRRLEALPKEISGKNGGPVRRALGRSARFIRDKVKRAAPRLTGNLEANIIAARVPKDLPSGVSERFVVSVRGRRKKYSNNVENRRSGRVGKTYQVDGSAFYWKFIEFGTARIPARPFINPTFAANAQAALSEFEKAMKADLDKLVRKLNPRA